MQKYPIFVLVVFLSLTGTLQAWGQSSVEPQWSEFYTSDVNQPVDPNLGGVLGHVRKKRLSKDNISYWNQRKAAYDREIKVCRGVENADQQVNCYMQLREIELQKNTMRLLMLKTH